MMGVRIFATSGSYPNIVKTGNALYTFSPEPGPIDFDYKKSLEFDDLPQIFLPECWESYYQIRTIIVKGTITASGADTLKTRMEKLDKLSFYYTSGSWTAQPEYSSSDSAQIYALEIDFPTSGADEIKTAYVVIESQHYTYSPGRRDLDFSITFREISYIESL